MVIAAVVVGLVVAWLAWEVRALRRGRAVEPVAPPKKPAGRRVPRARRR